MWFKSKKTNWWLHFLIDELMGLSTLIVTIIFPQAYFSFYNQVESRLVLLVEITEINICQV